MSVKLHLEQITMGMDAKHATIFDVIHKFTRKK